MEEFNVEEMILESNRKIYFEIEKIIVKKMILVLYKYKANKDFNSGTEVSNLVDFLEKYEGRLNKVNHAEWNNKISAELEEKIKAFNLSEGYQFIVHQPTPDYQFEHDPEKQIFKSVIRINPNDVEVDLGYMIETPPVYTPAQSYWKTLIKE